MPCPRKDQCGLEEVITSKFALVLWEAQYCGTEERFGTCVRLHLAEERRPIPARMLPNGHVLAVPA